MSNVATLEPRPQLAAGARPLAIVPQSMDEAYRLAKAVCMAGMAPKGLDTPEKAMVAVMHGLELGLTPMAALQRIAVVNGRPTIWGDGAIGLVRGSGLCEYVKEWIEGEGDKRTAFCEAKRRGEPSPAVRSFSVADAKRAGLWGKQGPWTQYPDRMTSMRARAFTLRDLFADVLGGLYLREELEELPPSPPRPPVPPAPPAIRHDEPKQLPAAPPTPEKDGEAVPPVASPSTNLTAEINAFQVAAEQCESIPDLEAAWDRHIEPSANRMTQDEYGRAMQIDGDARDRLEEAARAKKEGAS